MKINDFASKKNLELAWRYLSEKELSARTVRMTHAVLSSAMKQAVRWHMLQRNPCEFVDLPRMARKEMQALTPEEAGRFLHAAKADKLGIVLSFALATGMRPEEYLALKWSDLDLHGGNATVRRTLIRARAEAGISVSLRLRVAGERYRYRNRLYK